MVGLIGNKWRFSMDSVDDSVSIIYNVILSSR